VEILVLSTAFSARKFDVSIVEKEEEEREEEDIED